MFGKIQSFIKEENKIIIEFEGRKATVEVISPYIINFFAIVKSEIRLSKAIEDLKVVPCDIVTYSDDDVVVISTEALTVRIYENFKVDIYDALGNVLCEDYRGIHEPFERRSGDWQLAEREGHEKESSEVKFPIHVMKKMDKDMYFYGLGDKTGHLNKKGYHYKMWNTDEPKPHVESFEAMYKSIPFFIALKGQSAFGIFFDNTYETHFDMGKENSNYYYFSAVDGNLDYYFVYGPSIKEVIYGYTHLTGRTPLPQMWTLGYQQCRWSYDSKGRLLEIANSFREKDIPCDALYLDIDYMDGYRVFTFDENKFPKPVQTLKDLKADGFKVVTIIDPGVKKDKGYKVYDEGIQNNYFATDKDGVTYVNEVWPGESVYPDFPNPEVRKWWGEKQKIMQDFGVAGIWNDMNEPASFNGPLPDDVVFNNDGNITDHREMHNVYGHYMSKATYEGILKYSNKRPFVITRACYAGTQKYSTVWTGDNQSFWEHLRMSLPMHMNLGLSGISFVGTDVGGFNFDCSAELLSRWVQVGAFTPLFRNHSALMTRDQEPWAFDETTESINRKYIKLRYTLIPYLYDIFYKGEQNGLPVIRPLMIHYQKDTRTYEINDEFLFGEDILVAPIVEQGKYSRMVYLPKGDNWVDYWSNEVFEGGQYIIKAAPIDTCPIYIKQGTIVPKYPVQNYIGEKKIDELTLEVYPKANGEVASYTHYEDDGETFAYRSGEYNMYEVKVYYDNENQLLNINFNKPHNGYANKYKCFKFVIKALGVTNITFNEKLVSFENCGETLEFTVENS